MNSRRRYVIDEEVGSGGGSVPEMDLEDFLEAEPETELPMLQVGEVGEMKMLYPANKSLCTCCARWTEKVPLDDDNETVLKSKLARNRRATYAVIQRRERYGDEGGWTSFSIEINSPWLKKALEKVFTSYPGVKPSSPDLHFSPPYAEFCYCWDKFVAVVDQEQDTKTKEHLDLLKNSLEPELEDSFSMLDRFNSTGLIPFDGIPLVFIPGEIVLSGTEGSLRAAILRSIKLHELREEPDKAYYKLRVSMIGWDGERCGVKDLTWKIPHFDKPKKLISLRTFPLQHHPMAKVLEQSLIKRGRKFEGLRGVNHMFFSGIASVVDTSTFLDSGDKSLSERVVVDADMYHKHHIRRTSSLKPLRHLEDIEQYRRITQQHHTSRSRRYQPHNAEPSDDEYSDVEQMWAYDEPEQNNIPLTDQQCIVTFPSVYGFALQSKAWCKFKIDNLDEVSWKENVIDKLVLEETEKKLVLGLLSVNQSSESDKFDDIVQDKGKGIIMLLCGPPGVGKTLTAETVSEHLHQPLYRLGVSDLGTNVAEVERRLMLALERCAQWKAVLLLEEADVFLETRSTNSLRRNELVSVFLRLLEYYEGVMILTSNRSTAIDPAFESRIDITLAYDDLSSDGRAQVWRNFLQGLGSQSVVAEDDIGTLASIPLNGRQIRSAIKTARLLAAGQKKPLDLDHLKVVIALRTKAKALIGTAHPEGSSVSKKRTRDEESSSDENDVGQARWVYDGPFARR